MEIITLTSKNIQQVIAATAQALQSGKVVAAPTDTVYGLLANATNKKAVDRVYAIKQRDRLKSLPIFIKNMAMAKKFAVVGAREEKILEKVWPGKVTAVIKQNPDVKIFGVNGGTIAMRIPFYGFINSLLETFNLPLTGTSANISGKPAPTAIDDVISQFKNESIQPDIVINAGDLPASKPSTIIDLTQNEPMVIRK